MRTKVFSVYDQKAKVYSQPFISPTVGYAVRMFEDQVRTEGHAWNKHPEDYTLFEIGEYDDKSAEMIASKLQNHGVAIQYLDQETD